MSISPRKKVHLRRAKRAAWHLQEEGGETDEPVELPRYAVWKKDLDKPWEDDEFVEGATATAGAFARSLVARKVGNRKRRHWDMEEDATQEALLHALMHGKNNMSYIKRDMWWGAIRSIWYSTRHIAREMALTKGKHEKDPKDMKQALRSMQSKEKRHDYLCDCKDTVVVLVQKIDIEPWEIDLLMRHVMWGETYQALAKETGVSTQAMQNRLSTKLESMRKVALERGIPNPMDDLYKIEKEHNR